jgi:hypothetical protein
MNLTKRTRTSEVILKNLECPGNTGRPITSTITKAFLPEAKNKKCHNDQELAGGCLCQTITIYISRTFGSINWKREKCRL